MHRNLFIFVIVTLCLWNVTDLLGQVPKAVTVPLYVYVFHRAPLANDFDKQVAAAVEIWEKAGIVLEPKVTKMNEEQTKKLLGDKLTIVTYLGCVTRFNEPGFAQRTALNKLKPNTNSLAIFFGKSDGQPMAEREFMQAYMAEKFPADSSLGRTVAHEIGHLLLGNGHTGGQARVTPCTEPTIDVKKDVPWTSGLMRDGTKSDDSTISEADAETARKNAKKLPEAKAE